MKKIASIGTAFLILILGIVTVGINTVIAQAQNGTNADSSPYIIGKPGIGSVEELNKVLGNNTEMLTNGTSLKNDNTSIFQKLGQESNQSAVSGNQSAVSGNQSAVSGNQSAVSGNQSSNAEENKGNQTSNPISKIGEAIGDLFK
ncbi:MAG TPA: hypothetical protein VK250_00085 [Nitrososphaeraceae archaeon]|nr:hypothetical protein [Nitrososphaeraceae archaeon]